jgi:hypothetical protein
MDAAKEFGARGGTVIHARGTANSEAEKMFGITVQSEKEIVMILVPSDIKNDILHALYKAVGLKTPGQGIALLCLLQTLSVFRTRAAIKRQTDLKNIKLQKIPANRHNFGLRGFYYCLKFYRF